MAKFLANFFNLIFVFFILFLVNNQLVSAFNLDTHDFIRYEGQRGTMFGFSVTLHQEYSKTWVIIGAPKTDTSVIQPGVYNAGAVFKCDNAGDNSCSMVPFDQNGNTYNDNRDRVETKSDQWFGATVTSGGVNGPLVACAPRYVYHTNDPRKAERIEPVGNCFVARNNFRQFTQFSPCRTMYWGYHRQGSCQAGFSAAITKNGERMFIGAPGSWYWQGQVYSINTEDVFPYRPPRYGKFGEGGQLHSYSLSNPNNRVYETKESSVVEDDSYLGYSSVAGDFNGDGQEGVAVGMPRGGGLLGKVVIMSWNMTIQLNTTGDQIGAYFGYSVCAADVDGDSLMDLIVGAPMHTVHNNEGKYDVGRVHIYYQGQNNKFSRHEIRDGFKSKGRFGLSLSSLGDINHDKYQDFVVGAPYDGPNERGAVYIYYGSAAGVLEKYSQVIYAEDVAGTQLSTFGFSVGGGIDLDNNRYPDMIVGAYNSNNAILFRTKPVIVIAHASTRFASQLISLEGDKSCIVKKVNTTCTHIITCLEYTGVKVPPTIDIITNWTLDPKLLHGKRLHFLRNFNNTLIMAMRLQANLRTCHREDVYITDNIRDKLSPIVVEMSYSLYSNVKYSNYTRSPQSILEPTLDMNKLAMRNDSISIRKNCGENNICIPDLKLRIETIEKYLLSAKEKLEVEVFVSNFGDDAYEAEFYMQIPPGLSLLNYDKKSSYVLCIEKNNTLKCDIGNPMKKNDKIHFIVILELSENKMGKGANFVLKMGVNSTNPESGTLKDNTVTKEIPIWIRTNVTMAGVSKESSVFFNSVQFKEYENAVHEADLGPQVVHIYGMVNNGPSKIEEAVLFILWANETKDSEPLMYLLNDAETLGNVKCASSEYTNVRNLILDEAAKEKSYLKAKNEASGLVSGSESGSGSGSISGGSGSISGGSGSISGGSGSISGGSGSISGGSGSISGGSGSISGGSGSISGGSGSISGGSGSISGGSGGSGSISGGSGSISGGSGSISGGSGSISGGSGSISGGSGSISGGSGSISGGSGSISGGSGSISGGSGSISGGSGSISGGSGGSWQGGGSGGTVFYNKTVIITGTGIYKNLTSTNFTSGSVELTEEERRRLLDEEENADSTGDSSDDKIRRIAEESRIHGVGGSTVNMHGGGGSYGTHGGTSGSYVHGGGAGGGAGGGGTYKNHSYYETHSSQNGGPSHVTSKNSTFVNAGGNVHKFEASTEYYETVNRNSGQRQGTGSVVSQSGTYSHGNRNTNQQNSRDGRLQYGNYRDVQLDVNQDLSNPQNHGTSRVVTHQDRRQGGSAVNIGGSGIDFEKVAQGGGGLQTSSFDTGIINRGNVDNEMRSSSRGSNVNTGGGDGRGHTYHRTSSSSGTQGQGQGQGGGSQSYETHRVYHQNQGRPTPHYPGGQPIATDHYVDTSDINHQHNRNLEPIDNKFKHYDRFRREVPSEQHLELENLLHCNNTKCAIMRCEIGRLQPNESAWVAIRLRLVAKTMEKISGTSPLTLSTMGITNVTRLPYIGSPSEFTIATQEIFVTATPEPTAKPDVVPMWVVVLSACAGILILLLIAFLLYQCGFFNRNRPSDSSERQPLNRNGNYHGDEHL